MRQPHQKDISGMRHRSNRNSSFKQIAAMRARFPQFRVKHRDDFDIEFIGDLEVKKGFPIYSVSILYRGDYSPIVKILNPKLVDEAPHFYKNTQSICLFKPANYHWSHSKLIAFVIVPWVAGWIYFYEIWLRKKKWYGPEANHDPKEIKQ